MKVLIADKLSQNTTAALEAMGLAVQVDPKLTAEDLTSALSDVEILVVRSTKVTAEAIQNAPRLSLIIRAGAGVNTIDVSAASGRGVYVANCPGMNTAAVAELAIGLLVAADRRIVEAANSTKAGKWKKGEYGKSAGLKGRTLGLLGFGAIGKAVAKAALGLEMDVLAWSRSLTPEVAEQFGVRCAASPAEIASSSDAISVHLPFNPNTKHTVNKQFFDQMRDGAILVNTSRGELVDTAALVAAIETKKLRVGLDVYENEPAGSDGTFEQTDLANVVTAVPHIGASTDQAAEAIADDVVRIVGQFLKTGQPAGVVNLAQGTPATHNLVIRHLNRVGVLAQVLEGLKAENINVEEMENSIFSGAEAASCSMQLDGKPSDGFLKKLSQDSNVLQVALQACDC